MAQVSDINATENPYILVLSKVFVDLSCRRRLFPMMPSNIVYVLSLSTALCPKKNRSHCYFLNNYVKNEPILVILGTLNSEGTGH